MYCTLQATYLLMMNVAPDLAGSRQPVRRCLRRGLHGWAHPQLLAGQGLQAARGRPHQHQLQGLVAIGDLAI